MQSSRRSYWALIAVVILSGPAALPAQLATPPDWKWVLDAPARLVTGSTLPESSWSFVAMPPGWHLTTGPGAFVFHPAYEGRGQFSVEAEAFLFPGTSPHGWGIFLGGSDLERRDNRSYTMVLVRHDGALSITRQRGPNSETVKTWTPEPAVRAQRADSTARNNIRADVSRDSVTLFINGTRVAAFERAALPVDGTLGFRVGEGVNLHAIRLDVTYRLAPVPVRRP